MTEKLTALLLSALNEQGILAFREFPQSDRGLPAALFFVTAAVSDLECGAKVCGVHGAVRPVRLTVRLRYLCRPHADLHMYTEQADAALYGVLRDADWNIRKISRGEIRYQKQLDRLEQETLLVMDGVLRDSTAEEVAS